MGQSEADQFLGRLYRELYLFPSQEDPVELVILNAEFYLRVARTLFAGQTRTGTIFSQRPIDASTSPPTCFGIPVLKVKERTEPIILRTSDLEAATSSRDA